MVPIVTVFVVVTRLGVTVVVGLRVYFGLVMVDVSVSQSVVVVTDVLVSTGVITAVCQQKQVSIAMEGLTSWYCHGRSVHFRAGLGDCQFKVALYSNRTALFTVIRNYNHRPKTSLCQCQSTRLSTGRFVSHQSPLHICC